MAKAAHSTNCRDRPGRRDSARLSLVGLAPAAWASGLLSSSVSARVRILAKIGPDVVEVDLLLDRRVFTSTSASSTNSSA